jgi:hypothetical protein
MDITGFYNAIARDVHSYIHPSRGLTSWSFSHIAENLETCGKYAAASMLTLLMFGANLNVIVYPSNCFIIF